MTPPLTRRRATSTTTPVSVDGTTVTLSDPQARLDLGGVAKGWIAEAIERTLRDAGVTSALVNLGTSSIFALGTKPGGAPWVLGIRDPRADDLSTIMGTVRIAGRALVSSGLYDKHFVQDGVDYHHILDPKTGYPVQTDLSDVTVVLPSSFAGDVLSTALFVMGADEARAWLEDNPGLEAQAMFIPPGRGAALHRGLRRGVRVCRVRPGGRVGRWAGTWAGAKAGAKTSERRIGSRGRAAACRRRALPCGSRATDSRPDLASGAGGSPVPTWSSSW